MNGVFDIPEVLIAKYDPSLLCKHGSVFDQSDDKLYEECSRIVIFTGSTELFKDCRVMSRLTGGDCRCRQQPSGHDHLLWHLGSGKFVDYLAAYSFVHQWRGSGISMYEFVKYVSFSSI